MSDETTDPLDAAAQALLRRVIRTLKGGKSMGGGAQVLVVFLAEEASAAIDVLEGIERLVYDGKLRMEREPRVARAPSLGH